MVIELLNKHKNDILKYLFDTEKEFEAFEKNKEVKLGKLWDSILSYPNELYVLKRTKTNKKTIVSRVVDSLLKNINRAIHPILLIIFYYELRDYIKYNEMSNDDNENIQIQLTSKNKKYLKEIRPQINTTFKLYWKLINDKKIQKFYNYYIDNDLVDAIINSIYYNITVEQLIHLNETLIETKKVRFNDLCISLDVDEELLVKKISPIKYDRYIKIRENLNEKQKEFQTKILVEINESHHMPSIDFLRKTTIYETTGKTIIDFNIVDDDINDIYNKIIKEISKTIYKNYDEDIGIIFYLTNIENMEIGIATFFLDIYNATKKNKGIPIKTILNVFNNWEFVDKNKFIKLIKTELDCETYFITKNDDFKNSFLSSLGVDRLIFLPRKEDFVNTEEIITFVKMYNKFREGFFRTIEAFLNNDDETNIIIYLLKKLTFREDFEKFKEPLVNSFLEKILNEDLINAVEDKYKIELDKWLPILMKSKSKYHNIDTNIMKNSFGDKIANILEERFDTSKSEIKKRALIPKEVIEYIFNHKQKK
jgi:hypothetical protein